MERNSKTHKVIKLEDKQSYNSLVEILPSKLNEIEIRIKEYAVNLMCYSEYSDWNNEKEIGSIVSIPDQLISNCNDKVVSKLAKLCIEIENVAKEISDDNT